MSRVPRFTIRRKSPATMAPVILLCGVLFILPTSVFSQCAETRFGEPTHFNTGTQPETVVVGDFNLDGRQDLATANLRSDSVTVVLGNGSGGFSALSDFSVSSPQAVGRQPTSIVTADFNRDGKPDLATINNMWGNFTEGSISVLLGAGAGRFERANVFRVEGGIPFSVAAGDFNKDGSPDLTIAVSQSGRSVLSVYLGDGAGSFGSTMTLPLYNRTIQVGDIAVNDFNGDGQQDVAVAGSLQNYFSYPTLATVFSVFLGDGRSGFVKSFDFLRPDDQTEFVGTIAVGDFNGDGRPDVIVAPGQSRLVFSGDGRGGFTSPSVFRTAPTRSSAVADFNADGKLDLLGAFNGLIFVLLGDGGGSFRATSFRAGITPWGVATSDFNGDGKPDFAVTDISANDVSVFLNTCTSSTPSLLTEANSSRAIALDSVTFMRDPFPPTTTHNFSSDGRTRITLFAANINLSPGENSSIVTAQAEDSQRRIYTLPVEYVGTVPGFDWLTQVIIKLPAELNSAGDLSVWINARGSASNKALISIRQ